MLSLVLDNRERAVFEHFPNDDETINTAQMTVGDYAIISKDCIHEIFERKTLKDYADSIRDGRHENRKKMLSLRDECGCRVYYIIEGDLATADDVIGGLPKTTIEASIFNLMSNHNIFVLWTTSQADTARILLAKRKALTNSLKAKKLEYPYSVSSPMARLTAPPVVTLNQIKVDAIETYKGIGPKAATEIAKLFTLAQIITAPDTLPKVITVSGRKVKISFPENTIDRLEALKAMPRAGNISSLLDEADNITDRDSLVDAISVSFGKSMAKKLTMLVDHGYDE